MHCSSRLLLVATCLLVSLLTFRCGSSNPPLTPTIPPPAGSPTPEDPQGGNSDGGKNPPSATPFQYFPAGSLWYQDISKASVDSKSDIIISTLQSRGGWGTGEMRIDFSFEVLSADATTPKLSFIPTEDFYSDCDTALIPVPAGGALEGEQDYRCAQNGDCHLIVVDTSTQTLYEMWRANIQNNVFYGGCLAVWDMTKLYPASNRGEQCTSADASGMPIAPLLFSADEVSEAAKVSGSLNHAIRFILPNNRIAGSSGNHFYVHPATHTTKATSGGVNGVPYGARLRLKNDVATNAKIAALPTEGARVMARTLQKYGMILADGGNIALSTHSDRFTQTKWEGLLDSLSLQTLLVTDFEMIDGGVRFPYTGDCVLNQ